MKSPKIGGLRLIDLINPYKWRAYLQGEQKQQEVGYHYCEQVIIRSLLCSACLKAGKCRDCGCSTPAHFMATDNFCSEGAWTSMVQDPKQWEVIKKMQGFNLKLEFITDETNTGRASSTAGEDIGTNETVPTS